MYSILKMQIYIETYAYNDHCGFINKCAHKHFQTHPAPSSLRSCGGWF